PVLFLPRALTSMQCRRRCRVAHAAFRLNPLCAVAIVPAPKAHLIRYSGILAPAAKWRALIVPAGTAAECPHADDLQPVSEISHSATEPTSETATSPEPAATPSQDSRHGPNYTWAEL